MAERRGRDPGMVVINRYRESPNVLPPEREERVRGAVRGGRDAFARTTIRSERDEIRKMSFGHSDEAVVFLNGAPIYQGNSTLSFRQAEYLGLLDGASDAVYLPLKRDDNELLLGVTEFFGGRGFLCKLEPVRRLSLDSTDGLELVGATADVVSYRGRRAVRFLPSEARDQDGLLAIVASLVLEDGVIEADVAGTAAAGCAARDARLHRSRLPRLFGRTLRAGLPAADERPRRRSIAAELLRAIRLATGFPVASPPKGSPGVYESYADLEPGVWTRLRLVVEGDRARLYVDGAAQPSLIVNDLKGEARCGRIALWAHRTTDAYFSNLTVTR